MPPSVQRELLNWCNRGNPSSSYASAVEARDMMDTLRARMLAAVGMNQTHTVIFTSGASEANAQALNHVVGGGSNSYERAIPHLVVSAVEHKSLRDHVLHLVETDRCEITWVMPGPYGNIDPGAVRSAIRSNTRGVFVMHANNETGAVNNVAAIARECTLRRIHFHCDAVQSIFRLSLADNGSSPDTISMSFHKLHGPPGVGALIVRRGISITPLIFGSQNGGMRGGTENLPGLGAASAALTYTLTNRAQKTATVTRLANIIRREIDAAVPTRNHADYLVGRPVPFEVVWIGGDGFHPSLSGTILLSVVRRYGPKVCNGKLKGALEDAGIVVSIGSACNTSAAKASHVLYAMKCDEHIRRGALRISVGDENTIECVTGFLRVFLRLLAVERAMK